MTTATTTRINKNLVAEYPYTMVYLYMIKSMAILKAITIYGV